MLFESPSPQLCISTVNPSHVLQVSDFGGEKPKFLFVQKNSVEHTILRILERIHVTQDIFYEDFDSLNNDFHMLEIYQYAPGHALCFHRYICLVYFDAPLDDLIQVLSALVIAA